MKKKTPPDQKLVHPNSRKAKCLTKTMKRINNRQKSKNNHQMKQNLLGEKILWFRDNLPAEFEPIPSHTKDIVEKYLHRFDGELEQIALKRSISSQRQRQHASREDAINHTIQREREEFMTCGMELPNLMNADEVHKLLEWNGELRFIQNLKLCRIANKHLVNATQQCDAAQDETSSV